MGETMQDFIDRQNMRRFRMLLDDERDPAQRRRLEDMVAEERAKRRARAFASFKAEVDDDPLLKPGDASRGRPGGTPAK